MRRFNEGKACDAVIRRIEAREGHTRRDVRFPEREHHSAPVELTCRVGDQLFAFEHTGIEPFERHTELEVKANAHFKPIQDRVAGLLPATEHFELWVPVKATLDLKGRELRRVQDTIVDWVIATAPTLPIARLGRYVTPLRYTTLPDVPFEVFLARASLGGFLGQLSVKHLVDKSVKQDRIARIRRAYNDKASKLATWQKKLGARSVLIFEQNDIQITNEGLVADAVSQIEQTTVDRPDEIHLVSSAINAFWSLWVLRNGDHVYDDLGVWGNALLTDVDPKALANLTGR